MTWSYLLFGPALSISVRFGIGASIRISREIQCLPYTGIFSRSYGYLKSRIVIQVDFAQGCILPCCKIGLELYILGKGQHFDSLLPPGLFPVQFSCCHSMTNESGPVDNCVSFLGSADCRHWPVIIYNLSMARDPLLQVFAEEAPEMAFPQGPLHWPVQWAVASQYSQTFLR